MLNKVVAAAQLTRPDGALIGFTPHDFRRVFATDALAAGLPPHIIQKLMGHASLATTQGDAAILPDDVIRSHRAFIQNRRGLRPADEYRDVTADEGDDFEEHFAKRKMAIGDRMRAYGTNQLRARVRLRAVQARPSRCRRRTPTATDTQWAHRTARRSQPTRLARRNGTNPTHPRRDRRQARRDQRAQRRITTVELPMPGPKQPTA